MDKDKLIFEWEVPADHPNFSGYDDLAEAYRVFENNKADGGIYVEGLYRGKWFCNPSGRHLIRHLLLELSKAKEGKG